MDPSPVEFIKERLRYVIFDDPEYDGLSPDQVREKFKEWLARRREETGKQRIEVISVVCLLVDEEVLKSLTASESFVKVVETKPVIGDYEGYEGWLKVTFGYLYRLYTEAGYDGGLDQNIPPRRRNGEIPVYNRDWPEDVLIEQRVMPESMEEYLAS